MRPWRNWQTRTFEGRMVNPVRVQVSVAAPQSQQRRFSRVPAPLRCGHFAFTPCCDFSAKEKCKAFAPLLVFSRCCKTIAPLIHFSFAVRRLAPPSGAGCFLSVSCGRAASAARTKGCFLSVYSDSVLRAAPRFPHCCKTIALLIHFSFAVRRLAPPERLPVHFIFIKGRVCRRKSRAGFSAEGRGA